MLKKRAGDMAQPRIGRVIEVRSGPVPELNADGACGAILNDHGPKAAIEPHDARLIEILGKRGE